MSGFKNLAIKKLKMLKKARSIGIYENFSMQRLEKKYSQHLSQSSKKN